MWKLLLSLIFLCIELHAAPRLNFVNYDTKKYDTECCSKTYMKQTNTSIKQPYKNENKSTKFHLEFLLGKH